MKYFGLIRFIMIFCSSREACQLVCISIPSLVNRVAPSLISSFIRLITHLSLPGIGLELRTTLSPGRILIIGCSP